MAGPEIRIRFIGEDYVSGPAKRVAFSLNRILTITAGIAITRAIFGLGRAISDVAKQAWDAAAQFQTLEIRYEGLIARQMTATNVGDRFAKMLGEQTDMAGWQIENYLSLRDTLQGYVDIQERMIATGEDEGSYFDTITSLVDTYTQKVKDAIPGFEGLTDWQQQAATGSLDMADALNAAVGPAQDLIEWTKVMAVTTPFTADTLASANTLGMAMGFDVEQTKRLTMATGNFTAGMGLSQEVIERIIYNFGQMAMQSKVTGTELRDLARGGFVPIVDVLMEMQKDLGKSVMTFDDFRAAAAKGQQPVEAFFEAFMDIAERDFPNAMDRMSSTWQGVTSNISDFVSVVIGTEVLGPLVDTLSARMDASLKRMMTPEVREGFKELGVTVAAAFELIADKGSQLRESIGKLFSAFGMGAPSMDTLKKLIEGIAEAFGWLMDRMSGAADTLSTILKPAVDGVREALEKAKDIIEPFFEPIKEFTEKYGIDFTGVLDKAVELFMTIAGLSGALKIAGIAIKGIGVVIGKINLPLFILTTLVSVFATAWSDNWFGIRDTLTEVWEGTLKPAFEDIKYWFENELPASIESFKTLMLGKTDEAAKGFDGMMQKAGKLDVWKENLQDIIEVGIQPFIDAWEGVKSVFEEVGYWIQFLSDYFSNLLGPAIEPVATLIKDVLVFALETLGGWFENWFPIIQQIAGFIGDRLTAAFTIISTIISEVVIPAIMGAYDIFRNYIAPVLEKVAEAVGNLIGTLMRLATEIIQNVVIPILTTLRDWFNDHIAPAISAVLEVVGAISEKFNEFAVAFIQNIVIPALTTLREWVEDKVKKAFDALSTFIDEVINPALESLSEWVNEHVIPALEWLRDRILGPLKDGFEKLAGPIDKVTGWLGDLADKIKNIKLPSWLQPGSPTPFELGLVGINDQLSDFNKLLDDTSKKTRLMPNLESRLGTGNINLGVASGGLSGAATSVGTMNFYIYDAQDAKSVANEITMQLKAQGVIF